MICILLICYRWNKAVVAVPLSRPAYLTGLTYANNMSEIYQQHTGARFMRIYAGDRTIDGILVTVDGRALDPRLDLKQFSINGFEWTYEGDESRQLALAILADHLADDRRALALVEPFTRAVVANFDNTWEMTSDDVAAAVTAIEAAGTQGGDG